MPVRRNRLAEALDAFTRSLNRLSTACERFERAALISDTHELIAEGTLQRYHALHATFAEAARREAQLLKALDRTDPVLAWEHREQNVRSDFRTAMILILATHDFEPRCLDDEAVAFEYEYAKKFWPTLRDGFFDWRARCARLLDAIVISS